jgi:hypothetical protein
MVPPRSRALIIVLFLGLPLAAGAQQGEKVWRIGYLSPAEGHNPIDEVFERSMKDLGYIEGRNIRLERRYTAGRRISSRTPLLSWFASMLT